MGGRTGFLRYFSAEFGAEASLAGEGQLVVKGRFTGKQVETLLRKYISTYVTCAMCKSPQTKLERDPSTRLHNIKCESCGSFKSVPPIKAGFHATTRAHGCVFRPPPSLHGEGARGRDREGR